MNPRKIPKISIVASVAIVQWGKQNRDHEGDTIVLSKHNIGKLKRRYSK